MLTSPIDTCTRNGPLTPRSAQTQQAVQFEHVFAGGDPMAATLPDILPARSSVQPRTAHSPQAAGL